MHLPVTAFQELVNLINVTLDLVIKDQRDQELLDILLRHVQFLNTQLQSYYKIIWETKNNQGHANLKTLEKL